MTKRSTTTHLFIFLLCIYALTAGGHYGGDGFWHYLTAQSLVRDGDLVISDESFTLPEMQKHRDAITSSGRQYSKYGPGMPLAEIPFYAVGLLLTHIFPNIPAEYLTMFTTSMTNVVISALWVLFFFLILQSFNYTPTTTKWLTGAFALGTMVFPYSGYGFSEPLVGLGLLIATHSLIKRNPSPILAGIGLSIAILTKFYTLVLLPIPILYLHRNQYSKSHILAFLSPIIAACLLIAYHNHLRYGNILLTGYHLRHTRPKRRLSRLYTHTDLHRLLRPALQHRTRPHLLFSTNMSLAHRLLKIQIIAPKRSAPFSILHPDTICPSLTHDRLARRILVGTALFASHHPFLYFSARCPHRYQVDTPPHCTRLLHTTSRCAHEPLSFYTLCTGQKNKRDNLRASPDGRPDLFAQFIPHSRRLLPDHLGNLPPHNRAIAQLHHRLWHRAFCLRTHRKLRPHRHVVGQCPAHKYTQPNNDTRTHPRRNQPHTHRHLLCAASHLYLHQKDPNNLDRG